MWERQCKNDTGFSRRVLAVQSGSLFPTKCWNPLEALAMRVICASSPGYLWRAPSLVASMVVVARSQSKGGRMCPIRPPGSTILRRRLILRASAMPTRVIFHLDKRAMVRYIESASDWVPCSPRRNHSAGVRQGLAVLRRSPGHLVIWSKSSSSASVAKRLAGRFPLVTLHAKSCAGDFLPTRPKLI